MSFVAIEDEVGKTKTILCLRENELRVDSNSFPVQYIKPRGLYVKL